MARNNDVYKKVPCKSPMPPPSPPYAPGTSSSPINGASALGTKDDSKGSSKSNPAGTIVLVLVLLLVAAAAAVAVYKGWAKSMARTVAAWVRGDADANAYFRNRDSARAGSAGSTAPMQSPGLGPAGATTYNPPA